MRAMILAAGLGTRLRPLTYVMPKPVAPVLNVPIVARIAELLARHGFADVVTNLSYLPEQIRAVLGDGSGFGLRISYSEEPEPLGTAGGVSKVRDFLSETDSFLIISGDADRHRSLAMREAHDSNVKSGAIATLATKRVEDDAVRRSDHRRRRAHPGLPGEAGARGGPLRPRQLRDLHVPLGDLRPLPPPDHKSPADDEDQPRVRRLGGGRLSRPPRRRRPLPLARDRRLLERHRVHLEFVQGNLDALAGQVRIAPGPRRSHPGSTPATAPTSTRSR